jgi:hypothetical protein
LRDDRHRSGRKTLAQRAKSGDLEVKRQATWGMSVQTSPGEDDVTAGNGAVRGEDADPR